MDYIDERETDIQSSMAQIEKELHSKAELTSCSVENARRLTKSQASKSKLLALELRRQKNQIQ